MVHGDQRRLLRGRGQLGVEPVELSALQRATILSGSRRVQYDEPQRAEIDGIAHRLAVRAGDAELAMEREAVVVVARQHVHRCLKRSEQRAHLLVFPIGRVIRDVAGDEHRIGPRPDRTDRLDCRGEPGHGLIVEPRGTDVRIAQLREEKRPRQGENHRLPAGHRAALLVAAVTSQSSTQPQ